jgi:hypothetical protein
MKFKYIILCLLALSVSAIQAKQIKTIDMDDTSIDVRVFAAKGDVFLLGFPCDEGKCVAE